jgi:RNA polymerase sigma-70 factor (ECF subfamily)
MASRLPEDDVSTSQSRNAALSDPHTWDRWIEAVSPPAMLLVIGESMSSDVRAHFAPEDVWQETLLRAWRTRERFEWRGLSSFRRWLLQIAERCIWDAADRIKAQKRGGGARGLTIDGGSSPSDSRPDAAFALIASTTPSRVAAHREHSRAMREALDGLPTELREIVWLRLFEDLSCEEVAQKLDLGVSAVKHRFRKAGQLYRARLNHLLSTAASRAAPPSGAK